MLRRLEMDEELRLRGELVMSELVTNSVRHAELSRSQAIRLLVALAPSVLRLEVVDEGDGFEPVAASPDAGREPGGWGLWLVEKLTDRWGLEMGHSTQVWCEFDRDERPGA